MINQRHEIDKRNLLHDCYTKKNTPVQIAGFGIAQAGKSQPTEEKP